MGTGPIALGIGYFNNDTRLDIAVANYQTNTIEIFIGYESQPFAGMIPHSTGDESQPHSVAIGDINNDGRLDIVVANYGTDNIGIFLAYSNESFGAIILYSTEDDSAPYCLAVADLNNDHRLDIVVTTSETNNIFIFLGYGNGTFTIGAIYSTGVRSCPYTVVLGDLDNDKILDIVVANSDTSNIYLLYGYGNGTFGNKQSYALGYGYHPYSVAVKDLNQDGWMDIVIACYDTDHVEVLIKVC
jgi:hypothetical protein